MSIYSVLTTGSLIGNFDMPVCSYSLRQETSDGPLVRYAKVGDRIVHRWECVSPGLEGEYLEGGVMDRVSHAGFRQGQSIRDAGTFVHSGRRTREQSDRSGRAWVSPKSGRNYRKPRPLGRCCRCAIDPYILGHLSYNEDLLLAYREAHVFKFADQNALAFSCQIRLCVKAVDACTGMTVCRGRGEEKNVDSSHFRFYSHRNVCH